MRQVAEAVVSVTEMTTLECLVSGEAIQGFVVLHSGQGTASSRLLLLFGMMTLGFAG
jgi:hypothetical protein